jgi:hypothetical protein
MSGTISNVARRELTAAQTQYLNVIPQRRLRERQYSRRKKHSLVIWVRDQETDPLVPEFWEPAFRYANCVVP